MYSSGFGETAVDGRFSIHLIFINVIDIQDELSYICAAYQATYDPRRHPQLAATEIVVV